MASNRDETLGNYAGYGRERKKRLLSTDVRNCSQQGPSKKQTSLFSYLSVNPDEERKKGVMHELKLPAGPLPVSTNAHYNHRQKLDSRKLCPFYKKIPGRSADMHTIVIVSDVRYAWQYCQ